MEKLDVLKLACEGYPILCQGVDLGLEGYAGLDYRCIFQDRLEFFGRAGRHALTVSYIEFFIVEKDGYAGAGDLRWLAAPQGRDGGTGIAGGSTGPSVNPIPPRRSRVRVPPTHGCVGADGSAVPALLPLQAIGDLPDQADERREFVELEDLIDLWSPPEVEDHIFGGGFQRDIGLDGHEIAAERDVVAGGLEEVLLAGSQFRQVVIYALGSTVLAEQFGCAYRTYALHSGDVVG